MKKIYLLTSLILGVLFIFSTAVMAQEPIPFNDGFESGSLASYWTPSSSGDPSVSANIVYSGTYALDFSPDPGGASYVSVELESAAEPTLSFWYYFNGNYDDLDMTVDIKEADGTWTNDIWTDNVSSTTDQVKWLQANIDLSGYDTSGSFQLRFKVENSSDSHPAVHMDQVWVGGPSNPDPQGSSDNPLSEELTWDHATNVSKYDLKFGKAGNMETVEENVTVSGSSGSYSPSDLDYGTEYEWQIIYYKADGTQIDGPVWSFWTKMIADAGDGTESNPYRISSTSDLITLSQNSGYWDDHFKQVSDITFGSFETVDWNGDGSSGPTEGFSPIGVYHTLGKPFTGSYDGQSHTIDNLYIDRPSGNRVGLFGVTNGASVENLTLSGVDITGGNGSVGGLIGAASDTAVSNCHSSGTVEGSYDWDPYDGTGGLIGAVDPGTEAEDGLVKNSDTEGTVIGKDVVGGLIGFNEGRVENCHSDADVGDEDTGKFVGGLIGANGYEGGAYYNPNTVKGSHSTGEVQGTNQVGGLIGHNSNTSLVSCYSTSTVDASGKMVGGLIGNLRFVQEKIDNCHHEGGSVSGGSQVGGFIGSGGDVYLVNINNCYSEGTVEGGSSVGGFIGYSEKYPIYVNGAYSTGNATGENNVGGFIGTQLFHHYESHVNDGQLG